MESLKGLFFAAFFTTWLVYPAQTHDKEHPALESIHNGNLGLNPWSLTVPERPLLSDLKQQRTEPNIVSPQSLPTDDDGPYNSDIIGKLLQGENDRRTDNQKIPQKISKELLQQGERSIQVKPASPRDNQFRILREKMLQEDDAPKKTAMRRDIDGRVPFTKDLAARAQSCADGQCRCSDTQANCSHTNLPVVPKLPSGIIYLIFSFNNITTIDTDTFKNAPGLHYIDLSNNEIKNVGLGTFEALKNLKSLRLDHNQLTYASLTAVLLAAALRTLMINYMKLGQPPDGFFSKKPLPPLEFIDMRGSRIPHFNLSVFAPVKSLHRLRAADSEIVTLAEDYLPQLRRLDLQNNALFRLPQACRNGSSLFPNLQRLTLIQNKISGISTRICFPRLTYLDLSVNTFPVFTTDMFKEDKFPKLETLYVALNPLLRRIERFAFRSQTLKLLCLMYCSISFDTDYIHPEALAGMPRLTNLQVSHNLGSGISDTKFSMLFGDLKSLQTLYMGNFELHSISKASFSKLTQLRRLYLYRNKIPEIPDGAFDSLHKLETLMLGFNQIQTIRETTFSQATRKRLKRVDLTHNPFTCDCDLLWFRQWLLSSPHVFHSWDRNYSCGNIANTTLRSFTLAEQGCYLTRQQNEIVISCVTMFIIILGLVSVVFHYRWHIRLMLAFRGHSDIMRRRLREESFAFDIFVSCAEEDEAWVLDSLLPELEKRGGYRLCFHKRDFRPGKRILDNIVDCVKASKKFLMVFSQHFAQSNWCQFELDLCLGHVIDHDDALIVTCLGEMTSRDITSTMVAVMKTTTYIQWPEYPDAEASFWRRLHLSLQEIIPSNTKQQV